MRLGPIVATLIPPTIGSALGICSALAAPIDLAKWKYVAWTSSGSIVLIERASIKELPATVGRNFAVKQAWFLWEHSKDKTERARESKRLMRFDCEGQRIGAFAFVSYRSDGSLLSSWNKPDDYDFNYQAVVPESVGSTMLRAACAGSEDEADTTAEALEQAADRLEREAESSIPN